MELKEGISFQIQNFRMVHSRPVMDFFKCVYEGQCSSPVTMGNLELKGKKVGRSRTLMQRNVAQFVHHSLAATRRFP
jgi:hypothetical protein